MRFAIIDIGYNAIRAVVYEDNDLGAPEIFNKKFKNDVLNLLSQESFEIKHQTYLSIQYLLHIFKQLDVGAIKCVATAVLRDHPKAESFVDYMQRRYNFKINIISGEDEAKLTAKGLISGTGNCNGIAADLGGGSLELVEILNNNIVSLKSLPLGTKLIGLQNIKNADQLTKIISEQFNTDNNYENIYFIGGALRFIGRLYIDFSQHPIKNLHNFEIPAEEFVSYLNKINNSSQAPQNKKITKRKFNTNALLIAKALVKVFNPKNIIISTYGLKEGVRITSFDNKLLNTDIITAKIAYSINPNYMDIDFDSHFNIVKRLLPSPNKYQELFKLALMITPLKHRFDKTLTPESIEEYILASEIPFVHKTRVMLALILSNSSQTRPSTDLIKIAKKLISKKDSFACQIMGLFIAISEEIDGANCKTPTFDIKSDNQFLEIVWEGILPRPIFEKTCFYLKSIAYAGKSCSI